MILECGSPYGINACVQIVIFYFFLPFISAVLCEILHEVDVAVIAEPAFARKNPALVFYPVSRIFFAIKILAILKAV